ncbi:MAG TPA: DUF4493 domain-containing protein [Alistipes sp.]|mgnify:FL=1|uniref:DUF4493 domain-containing protein n=1 Tax=unclassified Alistipes TaxID=2608932 RepID=UPI002590C9DB|nr:MULTISPECIES: DUF4493 domain-containing protein [unclassified Alistipes]HUN15037.1 DUF4493 domain-containing protein [Alistipes sp.]
MKRYAILTLMALAAAGCAKEENGALAEGYGTLALTAECTNAVAAATRAQAELPAELIPTANELGLLVESADPEYEFTQVWPSLDDYDSENDFLWATHYKITLFSGTEYVGAGQSPEGIGQPYFEGSQTTLVSVGRGTTKIRITARLANTAVRIRFTERFRGYFGNGAKFKLTTEAGNEFEAGYDPGETPEKAEKAEKWYFVRPAEFSITGEATKQKPSATQPAQTIRFAETVNAAPKAGTLYTYTFDVAGAGDTDNTGEETFILNDNPIRTETVDEELNDDAKPDPAN